MDYLGKGEVFTNTDLDRFVNIEKVLDLLSSAHEKWGQKQKYFIYNFGQCNRLWKGPF